MSVIARFPCAAAAISFLVGVSVLVGWTTDTDLLKSIVSGLVTMKPNTAVAFLTSGAALYLLSWTDRSRVTGIAALFSACVTTLIGFLTLLEYVFALNLGIDELLFVDDPGAVGTAAPGRMSPATAVNNFLLGTVLLLEVRWKKFGAWATQIPTLAAMLLSVLGLLGYAYGVSGLYFKSEATTSIALHTAVTFLLLGVGMLCLRADRGFMRWLLASGPGGVMARWILPAAIIAPPCIGWLAKFGQQSGWFGGEYALALVVASHVVIFVAVALGGARSLHLAEERRRALETERDRYARFFSLSIDMFCLAGFDGYFKDLSPAWEKTLGYSKEELLSRPYADFVHPADLARTTAEAGSIGQGNDTILFENRYRCKDGTYRWLSWKSTPIIEAGIIYAVARDITDLKRDQIEIRNLNKELEGFSYSVSHDLRAPLRAVDGFSRILEEECGGKLDDEGKRLIGVIRSNTQQMGRLIDDLLSFSRMGRQSIQSSMVDMSGLVQSVLAEIRPGLEGRNIEIEIGSLPPAQGDAAMLRVVVMNLLSNAVKYTGKREAAQIRIGSRAEDGRVVYSIQDNGTGFDMKYVSKLFGVFQRLHDPSEYEGTGVGLALSQRIVHRHGGAIWAEAKLNEGATFHFSLPTEGGSV